MNETKKTMFAAAIALVCIFGFAYLYLDAMYKFHTNNNHSISPQYNYVATLLAGLIGGLVAMTFNEKIPDISDIPENMLLENDIEKPKPKSGNRDGIFFITQSMKITTSKVITIYASLYFITVVLAITVWIHYGEKTPELIKNLAMIGLGLMVAITRTFINISNS